MGSEALSVFYERLRRVKEYHTRFPLLAVPRPEKNDVSSLERQVDFSGAEHHGRHLDLHLFYDQFLNLNRTRLRREREPGFALSYRDFCGSFFEFDSAQEGKDADYVHYLQDLAAYLVDFLKRAQPLLDVPHLLHQIEKESEAQWENGSFRSWGEAETSDPLFCVPCGTRFAKQGTFDGHLKGKKHVASVKKYAVSGESHLKRVFLHEVRVNRLADSLGDVIQATIADIEKKQSRTLREQLDAMEAESDDDEGDSDADKDGDDDDLDNDAGFVKQIKNYPVGWDGEPIPYWLYRLHGLGVEYKCEICGNTSYWGRRAFEKHFEEFRHQSGMKLLGLPNTAHFFDVVRIKDAIEINKKLEAEKAKLWKPEDEMEMEDEQGRVYDRRTYELLKKAGVIREKKQQQK